MTRDTEERRVERLESARSQLWAAISKSDVAKLKSALRLGAEANVADLQGDTPLILASERGGLACVITLIEAGADLEGRNNRGETALMVAAFNARKEAVRELLKRGADAAAEDDRGMSALRWALALGDEPLCWELIAAGAARDGASHDTLGEAIRSGAFDVLKELAGAGGALRSTEPGGSLLFELAGARDEGAREAMAAWLAIELADELDDNIFGSSPLEALEARFGRDAPGAGALKAAIERRDIRRALDQAPLENRRQEGMARL